MVTFVDALREPEAPEHTIEKLVGVYRVLIPRKIAAYTYHLNATSRITDSPTQRSLGFMLQDEFEDWREGEMLLQSLIETDEDVERAARRQVELETLVLRGRAGSPARVPWVPSLQLKEPRYEEAAGPQKEMLGRASWLGTRGSSGPRSWTRSWTRGTRRWPSGTWARPSSSRTVPPRPTGPAT